jgi:hypothetical protein
MAKNPNMPSVDAFMEATTVRLGGKFGFAKLGPVLTRDRLFDVDIALRFWWDSPINDTDDKLRVTLRLMKACADWSRRHQTNQGASRTGAQRMIAVENVMRQCKLWLGLLNARAGRLRSLRPDYAAERAGYKTAKAAGQKINPIGGSYLHEVMDDADLDKSAIGSILAKPMDQMTEHDFLAVATALMPNNLHKARTLYMDSSDRESFALTVRNGELCSASGKPLSIAAAFAMDKYGTMHAADLGAVAQYSQNNHSTGYFNHSTFMAGKDVICAGTIEKFDTRLKRDEFRGLWMITTASGHYKPTADNLKNCLRSLQASGLDLDKIVAYAMFPSRIVERASTFVRS